VDLTSRPWQERREALERLAPSGSAWQLSPVYDDGPALLEATRERGLEGIVAKRRLSPYREGARSGDWVKLAHQRIESCVVGGWRSETDDAGRVGSLLLGVWSDGSGRRVLRYAGKAGSGLATADQRDLVRLLSSASKQASPFDPPVPRPDCVGAHWLEPRLVVEVRHLGHTDGGRLRQPVVLGVRPDLDAADLVEG